MRGARAGSLRAAALGGAAVWLAAGSALAQVPPPPVNLGPAQLLPQGSPIPRVLPPAPPRLAPGPLVQPAPSEGVPASGSVAVQRAEVTGSTAYTAAALAPALAGLTGSAVPIAHIQAARAAILARYRQDGYVLTAVKVTLDRGGTLRFVVTEGRIAEVKLQGDIGPAGVQVLRFLNHLTQLQPVDTASLERWLLLAQDVPGISLRAVLRPSTTDPGALTLIAVVSRQAFSGLVTADNRAYTLTGPQEGLLVLDGNSFTSLGEKTEVSLYGAAGATQVFGQVTSEFFVGGSGLKIRLYAGSGTADPTGLLGAAGYHGVTTVAGVAALYPLIRARQQTLNLGAYFDILQSTIDTAGQLASQDNLRVFRLGADYALQDLWAGAPRPAINTVSVRLSQGIEGLGSSVNGQTSPPPGRVGEQVNFTKIAFQAVRTQTLFAPWRGATVAVQGLVTGQYSGDVLPPAEKFFLGGSQCNRGYYSGQVTGDSALAVCSELQLNTGFTVNWFSRPVDVGTQFYLFYDWGEAWQNQRTDPNVRLTSEGGGVRLSLTRYTELDFEGVVRQNRTPQGASSVTPPLSADAFYWRVLARF